MKSLPLYLGLFASFALAIAYTLGFEPTWLFHLVTGSSQNGTGAMLMAGSIAATELKHISEMIETGNRTFEDFKGAISARLDSLETFEAKSRRPGLQHTATEESGTEKAYRDTFSSFLRKGTVSPDLEQKAMAVTTNSGADGGYAVPKMISDLIEKVALMYSPMRQLANVRQVTTSDYHKLVATTRSSSAWVGETAARAATQTPTFKDIVFPNAELYANPQVTQQMLDDAGFDVENWLADEVGQVFGAAESASFISGSGTSEPKGFLSAPTSAVTDSAGSRPFGTLQYIPTGVAGAFPATNPADLLLNVVFSMRAEYRKDAAWLMSSQVLQAARQFKDSQNRYIWEPSSQAGSPSMLFGFPVYESEFMPPIAGGSLSIAFGNFKRGYEIADRMGPRVLRDPFTNKPYVGFYTIKRVTGNVVNSEAIKLVKFSVS